MRPEHLVVVLLLLLAVATPTRALGVNWGTSSSHPLPPATVVAGLLRANNISRVKLLEADPGALESLTGTGIGVTVGIPNEMLRGLSSSKIAARSWVHNNVTRYLPGVKIEYIAVGDDPFLLSYRQQFQPFAVGAATNIQLAMAAAKLVNKVLGTFLTEWDEGRAICNTLLSTKESTQLYAKRLAELAAVLGFDGWLINMEVKLDIGQIANLKEFVKHLTQAMHSAVPGSLVIWYDSVTIDGSLDWQDQLDEKNKPFFDLCDGIFVDYTWKENYPNLSVALAGDRRFDVYMGIDVFGRNTYGGGQWKTNVALDLLKEDNVSAAVFAPGWVYETNQGPDFQTAQNRWWGLIQQSWGILQRFPKRLPFYSNFDQGHGSHFSLDGLEIAHDPWNNMSCQGFQPIIDSYTDPTQMQVFINFKDASYGGGGSITCKGRLRYDDSFSTRIFQGQLQLKDLPVHVKYSVKSVGNSLLGLSLGFSSSTHGTTSILLAHDTAAFPSMDQLTNNYTKVISPRVKKTDGAWVEYEASIAMRDGTLGDIGIFCCTKNSGHSVLLIKDVPMSENDTSTKHGLSDYHASLGHISIRASEHKTKFPSAHLWTVEDQYVSWSLNSTGSKLVSLKIIWELKEGSKNQFFTGYNIFVEKVAGQKIPDVKDSIGVGKEYLGFARVQAFYVSDLEVPIGVTALRFIIQVQGSDGGCQKLEKSPVLLLPVKGNSWSFRSIIQYGILLKFLKVIVNLCNSNKGPI